MDVQPYTIEKTILLDIADKKPAQTIALGVSGQQVAPGGQQYCRARSSDGTAAVSVMFLCDQEAGRKQTSMANCHELCLI